MSNLGETIAHTSAKVNYLELRHMKQFCLAHEICRQFMQVLSEYDWKGDCTWSVRTLRDLAIYWVRCVLLLIV